MYGIENTTAYRFQYPTEIYERKHVRVFMYKVIFSAPLKGLFFLAHEN